jgi:hypothetical protein
MPTSFGLTASSISLSAGELKPNSTNVYHIRAYANKVQNSLEKEPTRRASPWRMLEHPWMVEMKTKRVNMEKYLSQVWGWEEAVVDQTA